MKRALFFLLMIFVSFGVIANCETQAKDQDCFTIFTKGTIFSAFPVLNNKTMWRWYQNEDIGEYYWQTAYSALFDHGLASKSDQRFASIRSTGNLTFSTAF